MQIKFENQIGWEEQNISLKNILFIIIFILIVANGVIKTYFPLPINLLTFVYLSFFLANRYLIKYRNWEFVLIIYVGSFFQYALAQGGLFNIISFFSISSLIVIAKYRYENKNDDYLISSLLFVIFLNILLGYFLKSKLYIETNLGESSMFSAVQTFSSNLSFFLEKFLGVISFIGYVLIYLMISNMEMKPVRMKLFLYVSILFLFYAFIVSLNKYFMFIDIKIPLLGGEGRWGSSNLGGTFGPSPILGEYSLLLYSILLPFANSKISNEVYKINKKYIIFGLLSCLLSILIAASRSVILLTFLLTVLYFVIIVFSQNKTRTNIIKFAFVIIFVALIFYFIAPLLNLDIVIGRFSNVFFDEFSIEGIISGEQINRETAFEIGEEMIERENWLIGYGWGTPDYNRYAWFGVVGFFRGDPHSLYYSLPMLFGWTGSLAFILIFLITIYRLFLVFTSNYNKVEYLRIPAIGFFLLFIFFLINEYKITALSNPHYFMIIWIFLGIGNSIYHTYLQKIK